jgi:aminodeoxyfutalosine synthase
MVTVDIEELGARIAAGAALTSTELRELAQRRDPIGLGMLASDVRARLHGARGTFVRVETLDVAAASAAAIDVPADAGEVRLTGTPASLEAAVAAVRAVRAATAQPVSGWALDDLATLGASLADTLAALRAAGLDAVATARLDRLDLVHLRAVADAGLVVQSVTLGAPADGDALLDQLEQLRAWQATAGVVRACSPLPVETSPEQPTTGYDDMRRVALARLVLDNVAHVSAHWTRMGAKLSQACLLFGADDIDGVPARDDMPHGPRRAILEEVRRNLAAASLEPVERDGAWQPRSGA